MRYYFLRPSDKLELTNNSKITNFPQLYSPLLKPELCKIRKFSLNSATISPSSFWAVSRVSAPGPRHLPSSNMAASCTLVPAPTPQSVRRSCAFVSSSLSARHEAMLDRVRCYNCWGSLCCHLNKEMIVGWYHCSCVEDLESVRGVRKTACFSLKIKLNTSSKPCTDKVVYVSNLVYIPCPDLGNTKDIYQGWFQLI